jgi:predicted esterase
VRFTLVFALLCGALAWLLPSRAWARAGAAQLGEPMRLEVPGQPDAYYYRPARRGPMPVLMYLHGRGGNPAEDCRKWARVATQFGWVVCPQGPDDRGGGARAWNNSVPAGKQATDAALAALRAKYKKRVASRGHILIGFSEGAFVAMQLGLQEPSRWQRWLILAANDQYWWGDTVGTLRDNRAKLRRIYLLTGENDEVVENTRRVFSTLKDAKVHARMRIVPGMGHEVPADRMISTYRRPLLWLASSK